MNDEARKEAEKVLNRMKQEGKDSHEYGLLYDYLDFMTSLDWKAPQFTPIDLDRAEQILDEDHYGLKKSKNASSSNSPLWLSTEAIWLDPFICRCSWNREDQYRTKYCTGSRKRICKDQSWWYP